ncbi:HECT-like protein [Artemisia annua]|uniref:HECT-like protein n=1 Tax=Artemisia annua TaxID=35608 RepID=A0A2U1MBJ2_ARTAN|nr:HECT-like protein [Artemisia annua]
MGCGVGPEVTGTFKSAIRRCNVTHLDRKVMGLLEVVVYIAASSPVSQSHSEEPVDSSQAQEAISKPQEDSSSAVAGPKQDDKSVTDNFSTLDDPKKVNVNNIFMKLPETDLHNLCSLLDDKVAKNDNNQEHVTMWKLNVSLEPLWQELSEYVMGLLELVVYIAASSPVSQSHSEEPVDSSQVQEAISKPQEDSSSAVAGPKQDDKSVTDNFSTLDDPKKLNLSFVKLNVFVTGASGFVSSCLLSGYHVVGTVRDPGNDTKVAHLWNLQGAKERLGLVKAELTNMEALIMQSWDVMVSFTWLPQFLDSLLSCNSTTRTRCRSNFCKGMFNKRHQQEINQQSPLPN